MKEPARKGQLWWQTGVKTTDQTRPPLFCCCTRPPPASSDQQHPQNRLEKSNVSLLVLRMSRVGHLRVHLPSREAKQPLRRPTVIVSLTRKVQPTGTTPSRWRQRIPHRSHYPGFYAQPRSGRRSSFCTRRSSSEHVASRPVHAHRQIHHCIS